jgi:tRNA-specific 2-thiouridylase
VPDGDHTRVIALQLGRDNPSLQPGPVVTREGRVIAQHDGFARYTVGQRRGLPGGASRAQYVVAIRPADRAVVVGDRDALLTSTVVAREVNWLADGSPRHGDRVAVQVRHRGATAVASVRRVDGVGPRGPLELELALHTPLAAVTPGQSVVLYDEERVLGGGVIECALPVGESAGT